MRKASEAHLRYSRLPAASIFMLWRRTYPLHLRRQLRNSVFALTPCTHDLLCLPHPRINQPYRPSSTSSPLPFNPQACCVERAGSHPPTINPSRLIVLAGRRTTASLNTCSRRSTTGPIRSYSRSAFISNPSSLRPHKANNQV